MPFCLKKEFDNDHKPSHRYDDMKSYNKCCIMLLRFNFILLVNILT